MPDILSGGAPLPDTHKADQLRRQPLEICCKMSSITLGTSVAKCLSELMSTNMSPPGAFEGL